MLDPKRMNMPKDEKKPGEPSKPDAVGFGAFSEQYRARWASKHPDMQRRFPIEFETPVIDTHSNGVIGPKQRVDGSATPPATEKE